MRVSEMRTMACEMREEHLKEVDGVAMRNPLKTQNSHKNDRITPHTDTYT